jgi:hypothetical protein
MPEKVSLPDKDYKPIGAPARKYVEIPVPSTEYPMLFEAQKTLIHKVRIYKEIKSTTVYVPSSELGLSQPLSR